MLILAPEPDLQVLQSMNLDSEYDHPIGIYEILGAVGPVHKSQAAAHLCFSHVFIWGNRSWAMTRLALKLLQLPSCWHAQVLASWKDGHVEGWLGMRMRMLQLQHMLAAARYLPCEAKLWLTHL